MAVTIGWSIVGLMACGLLYLAWLDLKNSYRVDAVRKDLEEAEKREAVLWEDKKRLDKILEQIQLLQTAIQTGSAYVMAMERLFSMKHICKEARMEGE